VSVRTGAELIAGLRARPREVWLRGKRVEDITTHPAFVKPLGQLAALYDLQHDPAFRDILTYPSPTSAEPVATAFMVPRTQADLFKRREAFRVVAEATLGMMGRSPDFLNTTLMAFAEAHDVFGRGGQRFADNVTRYYEFVRERDLFLTHALITPQIDRAKSSAQQADAFLHMGVVRESADGLVVRGARMLATLAPLADELAIYNLPGLKPGDEPHAVVFAIPMDTPGLRFICREPFDEGGRSSFDHPLASNFEEADALVVFEDVLVPWERVFLYRDVTLGNALYPDTNLRQHTAHQTAVRGLVKMQLAVGVAMPWPGRSRPTRSCTCRRCWASVSPTSSSSSPASYGRRSSTSAPAGAQSARASRRCRHSASSCRASTRASSRSSRRSVPVGCWPCRRGTTSAAPSAR
jgi:anthranilate 3-monooxygenase (FAD) / 4-hydroxyphenylacetate 3-monooxygenase